MNRNSKKGFTLIELLIVVAIIGILSSVILVSLNSARNKSNGSAFKSSMSSIKGAIALCCATPTNTLRAYNGTSAYSTTVGKVCSDVAVGSYYPKNIDMKANSVVYGFANNINRRCNGTARLRVTVAGSKNPYCDGTYYVTSSDIKFGTITGFPAGC
ncbi:MAG: type II secretion system protein [Candidatus Moranbacteria bacterium]|nr:type II secretion system protein [Candidatus Moranbacteria bacterium]